MNTLLKVAGILGGTALIATAVITSPENTSIPVQNETVQEISKAKAFNQVEKPSQMATTSVKTTQEPTEIKKIATPPPKPLVTKPASNCHPDYSGCLKINAGDYDCASGSGNGPNYTGAVEVYGSDPFDLDRDNDGWGCE